VPVTVNLRGDVYELLAWDARRPAYPVGQVPYYEGGVADLLEALATDLKEQICIDYDCAKLNAEGK
jgi:hypothetical protein